MGSGYNVFVARRTSKVTERIQLMNDMQWNDITARLDGSKIVSMSWLDSV